MTRSRTPKIRHRQMDAMPRSPRQLVLVLVSIELVVAAVGSLGPPLIPPVARHCGVSLGEAQWTLTIALLTGALSIPILAQLGDGPHRRRVVVSTLGVVVVGSVATVASAGLISVLIGRALQGVAVGLTSLVISVARDELPEEKAGSVIGVLSVTSIAGAGLGYPAAGFLAEHGGLRAAYGAGLLVALAALVAAAWLLPPDRDRPAVSVDICGAFLLGILVTGLLVAANQVTASTSPRWAIAAVVSVCVVLGAWWVRHELATDAPLVDLRQLRIPVVAVANASILTGGLGFYLLISLTSRYVQTPVAAGYGVHGGPITAGLILVPLSLMSFAAIRFIALLRRWMNPAALTPVACVICVSAAVVFVVFRGGLWNVLVVTGITGLGVGTMFASVPVIIVAAVPADKAASAIGFNLLVRTIGVAIGSAVCGIMLQGYPRWCNDSNRFGIHHRYARRSRGAADDRDRKRRWPAIRPSPPGASLR